PSRSRSRPRSATTLCVSLAEVPWIICSFSPRTSTPWSSLSLTSASGSNSIPGETQAKLQEGIASTVAALALEMGTLQALECEVENLGVERFSFPQADGRLVTWLTLP